MQNYYCACRRAIARTGYFFSSNVKVLAAIHSETDLDKSLTTKRFIIFDISVNTVFIYCFLSIAVRLIAMMLWFINGAKVSWMAWGGNSQNRLFLRTDTSNQIIENVINDDNPTMKYLLFLFTILRITSVGHAQNLDQVIQFIKDNPKKSSVYLMDNGQLTIDYNSSQLKPLASAAKTIIAIEFSKQAAAKQIDASQKVSVKDVAIYYVPNTDGSAFPNWLKSINKTTADSVTLLEIAKGMIRFSSNASTEYLEDLLGLDNINANLKQLGLQRHQPLYYFTSSAVMACLKPAAMDDQAWTKYLWSLPMDVYRSRCKESHLRLKNNPAYLRSFSFDNLSMRIQKVWSDRLVSSTTKDYATIMQKINSRAYFDAETQSVLESIMEWPMVFPANKERFLHLGQKGGSTAFVLTDAFYATDKQGKTIECAFFFNDMDTQEDQMISKNFGQFEASIITNASFRQKLAAALK